MTPFSLALVERIAEHPGHHVLTGDHEGGIPISSVTFETVDGDGNVITQPNDGVLAFGRITLSFHEFLPERSLFAVTFRRADRSGR